MTPYRLEKGGLVDRSTALRFSFDGKLMSGFAGDSLASALLANGTLLVGRSFKYHRPRGIMTAGAAEPSALLTIGTGGRTTPNTRATMQPLFDGLSARSQNRWPTLQHDIGALNGLLSPFLSAGFYYKTFMWPKPFWEKVYEPFIRRAAGLGRASYEDDPDTYEKCWAHCNLAIVGAGAAGLAAALTAGRSGARVILVDEQREPGGFLLSESAMIGGGPASAFVAEAVAELRGLPNVRILKRTTAFGWYDGNVIGAIELTGNGAGPAERLWRIAAGRILLATGAEERPLVFGGNDIPGVMLAGAMRTYLNRYGVAPGRRVAIFTTNDSGYALAADLERAGIVPAAIVDSRAEGPEWAGAARVVRGAYVCDARGGRALSAITILKDGNREAIDVDALAVSGGFSPIIHLACHRGGRPVWNEVAGAFLAPGKLDGLALSGAAKGVSGLSAAMESGAAHAVGLLRDLGINAFPFEPSDIEGDTAQAPSKPLWTIPGIKGKAFVDFQNDVHKGDLGLAVREGYGHVELAKRYTTNGMATDQGKLSNINAIGLLAEARGVSPAEVGTTTFRPFYTPVSFGALTGTHHGRHFQPVRKSPLHGWAEKNGAQFTETGLWYRSAWFPRDGETGWRQSVDREVLNVRENAGLCDVSMLGKIEVCGTDAAEFLNRIYANGFLKLPVGKARYGLMLREDGHIYDDGTTSRLGETRYFMTTTTAGAAGVLNHLEFCAQVHWPELDVQLASVTDQWAQMAIAGPKSRLILSALVDDDISDAVVPFLAAREVTLCNGQVAARLFRISFSGELAYELAVPAGYGESVADALMAAGREHGLQPYGVEAMSVLRIEKGHVTHNEINGTVVPDDLGFGRMVSTKKRDFIGKAMLGRDGLTAPGRLQLVGVVPLEKDGMFSAGAHILRSGDAATLENDQGHVTSAAFSPHLGSMIGLALASAGRSRHGEAVVVWDGLRGRSTPARLCDPVFYDPSNEKLHG
ncbi:sarcosine oxidase subunit alpha family protein [Martelella endophytica]|uniref:Sarcosine oxidase subunit alpha n=1 Tax=Martelella endophytica TaxID=1486262 RepID=A0A0D5LQQ7_MAREN|nr:sarcosine oxidase subunit alpha family protein [Martelella endophytica]AJY46280.1 sarcosine oxidase subunit alpha [Martelella endophytica]